MSLCIQMTRYAKKQETTAHNEEKNQSPGAKPEMTNVTELADKDS